MFATNNDLHIAYGLPPIVFYNTFVWYIAPLSNKLVKFAEYLVI